MNPFTRSRRGVEVRLGQTETLIIRTMIADLESSLAADENISDLRRLFPPAYEDDEKMQEEFVGLTRDDLMEHKRQALRRATETLDRAKVKRGELKVMLDEDEQQAWLGVLNDLRLTLGTRLDVTEEAYAGALDDRGMQVYHYLGWLEENLVECLLA